MARLADETNLGDGLRSDAEHRVSEDCHYEGLAHADVEPVDLPHAGKSESKN